MMQIHKRQGVSDPIELELLVDLYIDSFREVMGWKGDDVREPVLEAVRLGEEHHGIMGEGSLSYSPSIYERHKVWLADPSTTTLVAYVDEKLAGFLIYTTLKKYSTVKSLFNVAIKERKSSDGGILRYSLFLNSLSEGDGPFSSEHGKVVLPEMGECKFQELDEGDIIKVGTVIVPDLRRQNIATQLTERAIVEARSDGTKHIFSVCHPPMSDINKTCGFETMIKVERLYRTGQDAYFMGRVV